MADARTSRQARNVRKRVSRIDEERWGAVCSVCGMERSVLCRFHPLGSGRMRSVLRSVRSYRPPGPDHHPDGTETGLLLFVAVRFAVIPAACNGDASSPHWPRSRYRVSCFAAISFWRRRKELAPAADRCFDGSADRHNPGNTHPSRWLYAVESAHECVERRPRAGAVSTRQDCSRAARRARLPGQAMPQLSFSRRLRCTKIEIDSCRLTFISSSAPGNFRSRSRWLCFSQQPCTCTDGFPLAQLLRAPFQPGRPATSFSAWLWFGRRGDRRSRPTTTAC